MQTAAHPISSLSSPVSNFSLSPTQASIVVALAQGKSVSAAARQTGIHRTTVHNWMRNEPDFKAAVHRAKREYIELLNDQLRELAAGALQTLHTLIEDPAIPSTVRLKAALAVLERPQLPDGGWSLPERIDSRA